MKVSTGGVVLWSNNHRNVLLDRERFVMQKIIADAVCIRVAGVTVISTNSYVRMSYHPLSNMAQVAFQRGE